MGWLIVIGFLPLVAGYHLSFLFRTINATLAPDLVRDLAFGRADLGLMTATYFLTFAAAQIPLGIALDRFGPRRVQTVLLLLAAIGSGLTAVAEDVTTITVARGLIGLGVATALMAGMKANAVWFPGPGKALANGTFMALGAAGAVAATYPVEWMLHWVTWREVMSALAALTGLLALVTFVCVPELPSPVARPRVMDPLVFRELGRARFWALALVAASSSGAGFALQGLWIERWLTDVVRLPRAEIMAILHTMALSLSLAAALVGLVASEILRRGGTLRSLLGAMLLILMISEFALVVRYPVAVVVPCSILSAMVAVTVVVFTYSQTLFPASALGTLNGILNTFNMGGAFAVQAGFGYALAMVEGRSGSGTEVAYAVVWIVLIALQVMAFALFMSVTVPPRAKPAPHPS